MTATMYDAATPAQHQRRLRVRVRSFRMGGIGVGPEALWVGVPIWLAVPVVGVFSGDIVTNNTRIGRKAGVRSKTPAVVPVAAMAAVATFFVT